MTGRSQRAAATAFGPGAPDQSKPDRDEDAAPQSSDQAGADAEERSRWNENARSSSPNGRGTGRQSALTWTPDEEGVTTIQRAMQSWHRAECARVKSQQELAQIRRDPAFEVCVASPDAKVVRVITDPTGEAGRIPGEIVECERGEVRPWASPAGDRIAFGTHKCALAPDAALKTFLTFAAWFGADVVEIEGRWGLRWFFDVELSRTSDGSDPDPYIRRFVLVVTGTRCEIVEACLPANTPFILDISHPERQYWGTRPLADDGRGTRA